MPFCLRCGKSVPEGGSFCPYCGEPVKSRTADPLNDPVQEEAFRTFIGKKADYYLKKFQGFQTGKEEGFAVTWNWSAFWLGFIWMLYRKMYLWSLVAFFIALTPIAYPLNMIGWGITGNYLYFRQARKKIIEFKSRQAISPVAPSLDEVGGVNRWVRFVGVILFLFLMIAVTLGGLLFLHLLRYYWLEWPSFIEI